MENSSEALINSRKYPRNFSVLIFREKFKKFQKLGCYRHVQPTEAKSGHTGNSNSVLKQIRPKHSVERSEQTEALGRHTADQSTRQDDQSTPDYLSHSAVIQLTGALGKTEDPERILRTTGNETGRTEDKAYEDSAQDNRSIFRQHRFQERINRFLDI